MLQKIYDGVSRVEGKSVHHVEKVEEIPGADNPSAITLPYQRFTDDSIYIPQGRGTKGQSLWLLQVEELVNADPMLALLLWLLKKAKDRQLLVP